MLVDPGSDLGFELVALGITEENLGKVSVAASFEF